MPAYLVRRVAIGVLTILTVASVVFVVLRVTADPVSAILPSYATAADEALLRARLGLDKPIGVQYVSFLRGLATGDLGTSFRLGVPVKDLIVERLPATIQLVATATAVAVAFAVPAGVLAAVYRRSIWDALVNILSFLGISVPVFWLGIMMMIVFAVNLHWLPTSGMGSWRHLVLPALSLAVWPFSELTRVLRTELLDVLGEDFIRTARAKGLSTFRIHFKHALRPVAVPFITIAGLTLGALLGGAIVTETVFAWPGMGQLVVQAVSGRDFPLVQAAVVYFSAIYVVVNLLVDVFYTVFDPRIRYQ